MIRLGNRIKTLDDWNKLDDTEKNKVYPGEIAFIKPDDDLLGNGYGFKINLENEPKNFKDLDKTFMFTEVLYCDNVENGMDDIINDKIAFKNKRYLKDISNAGIYLIHSGKIGYSDNDAPLDEYFQQNNFSILFVDVSSSNKTNFQYTQSIIYEGKIQYRTKVGNSGSEDFNDKPWSDWQNQYGGFTSDSFQTEKSCASGKAYRIEGYWTEGDVGFYKLNRVLTQEEKNFLKNKPYSLVLTANYDFQGVITEVFDDALGVTNFVEPDTNSDTAIKNDKKNNDYSYIQIPYTNINYEDDYTWFKQYINEVDKGGHLYGDYIISDGAASFGIGNTVESYCGFGAGYQNIVAGKLGAAFGRWNMTGYCDFAAGQNLHILGQWCGGFGRDNRIDRVAQYSFVTGFRNVIKKSCGSAFGRGHNLDMEYASARGKYSEDDLNNKYVDRVGYGNSDDDRKNIYTLDTEGNAWFRGNLRIGGNNYDDAKDPMGVREISSLEELTLIPSILGDVVQIPYSIAQWNRKYSKQIKLQTPNGDCQYDNVSMEGVDCIKIPKKTDGINYAYFKLTDFTDANPSDTDYKIRIKYLDNGTDAVYFEYTTKSGQSWQSFYRTNTGEWKTYVWQIEDALFDSDTLYQNENHIRFYAKKENEEVYLAEVSVERGKDIYILTSSEKDGYKDISNWTKLTGNMINLLNISKSKYATARGKNTIAGADVTYDVKNFGFNGHDAKRIIVSNSELLEKIKIGDVWSGEFTYDIDVGGYIVPGGTRKFNAVVVGIENNEVILDRAVASDNLNAWLVKESSVIGVRYNAQVVDGMFNIEDTEAKYLHITGNGISDNQRSNAYTIDKNGVAWFKGGVRVGGANQDEGSTVMFNSDFKHVTTIVADGETVYWTISQDKDGNELNVHEVYILVNHADASGYQAIYINGDREHLRTSVSKRVEEYCYFSLDSNFLTGIVGKLSSDRIVSQKTEYIGKVVSYDAINEIKFGGYTTSALPAGTKFQVYVR